MAQRIIEAAGGALWRPAGVDVEVALVHRPKYDDWSLPKGKLIKSEHPILGAVREVCEETGIRGVPGRPLGEIHYLKEGVPKRVRYWAMRADAGEFTANAEVDELVWLAPWEARERLLPERDRSILDGVARAGLDTWAVALLRHASAGERATWKGADLDRPLDARGHEQSLTLAPLLAAYRLARILSAPALRCVQTVTPAATCLGRAVTTEPWLAETAYEQEPRQALAQLIEILGAAEATVVCGHGGAVDALADALLAQLSSTAWAASPLRKGELLMLHVRHGAGRPRVVDVEQIGVSAVAG